MDARRWTMMMIAVMIAMLALVSPRSAAANGFLVGDPVRICLSGAPTTPRAAFADPARFDCGTPQTALPAGDYWALSTPLPPRSARVPVAIRFASVWQRDATLYALYADGHIARMRLDGHTLTRRIQIGAVMEQPLPLRASPAVRLLWHIKGSPNLRGILTGTYLATHADSAHAGLMFASLYAGFAGLCIALLVYNIALLVALRHGFQLAYCAMIVALLVYAFSESGLLAWTWPGIANNDRIRVNYMALAAAGAAALLFARTFFEPRVFAGWLGKATTAGIAALVLSSGAVALLAPWHIAVLDRLYSSSFLAAVLVIPAILWRAWAVRSNYLWAFAVAWAAPILLASTRIANAFHLVSWNFWLENSTLAAMATEALLSSVGIAYRMRVIAAERDDARARETVARLLADTDPLTGMLNRRAFLHRVIGSEGEQVLLLADIDHFKRVNETIGHDGGDEVLRSIARALEAAIPAGALAARIGGEEFAIVAPVSLGIDPNDILDRIRGARMPYDLAVTASIGACTGPLMRETDWKAMYRNADRALFAAKAAGRDRARRAAALAVAA